MLVLIFKVLVTVRKGATSRLRGRSLSQSGNTVLTANKIISSDYFLADSSDRFSALFKVNGDVTNSKLLFFYRILRSNVPFPWAWKVFFFSSLNSVVEGNRGF